MKKILSYSLLTLVAVSAIYVMAADHIEAPAVTGTPADITDIYAFESPENPKNLVLVYNVQGLLDPAATSNAAFDQRTLLEFNIDNDGDNVEDLVIQALFRRDKVVVTGPVEPSMTGLVSRRERSAYTIFADVTSYGEAPKFTEKDGIKVFAGPRDDPFFFDSRQFNAVVAGQASSFNSPGDDTFAGTNVLSLVIELPKKLLGNGNINLWAESKSPRARN